MTVTPTLAARLQGRDNNFDFLRFFAASLVIFSHAFGLAQGKGSHEPLAVLTQDHVSLGSFAVAVFFVVSGFLITMSYDNSAGNREYLLKRCLRIFPGLAVVLLVTALVIGPLVTILPLPSYFAAPQTWGYLGNILLFDMDEHLPGVFRDNPHAPIVNGSLWTLWYEFVCYLLVMLLGWLGWLRWQVMAFVVAASVIVRINLSGVPVLWHLNDAFTWLRWQSDYLDLLPYFASGALLYQLRHRIPLSGGLALVALGVLVAGALTGHFPQAFVLAGGYFILYLAFAPWLKLGRFAKYGDFSYGLYIYAYPVQQAVSHFLGAAVTWWSNALIAYPIVVLCAAASWHWVEGPALASKKRLHAFFIRS